MKNQTQIERKNKSKPQPTQQGQQGIGVCITRQSNEALLSLAATLEVAPLQIAERAIKNYLRFIRENVELAAAQPRFKKCNATLGRLRKDISDRLVLTCEINDLKPSQVVDSAISAYLEYAEDVRTQLPALWHFIEETPGEMDPAQIAGILSTSSTRAREAFTTIVAEIKSRPFSQACDQLKGFLELTMHHPGLEPGASGWR
jgi:hypothetical protein